MKKQIYIWLLITFLSFSAFAQEEESTRQIGLPLISQVNQGNSYITFPSDIGNIEPLWFEGNIIPNFYLRRSKNSRMMGVLTSQIIIRMYQEESYPVRTPSYMPQITVYYRLTDSEKVNNLNLFGRAGHHSNGQDGNFFLEDNSINLTSASFGTNFLEFGVIATNENARFNAYQFFKSSFEIHPEGVIQEELLGIYSRYRWHNAFSIFQLNSNNEKNSAQKPTLSLKGESTWMFGDYNQLDALSIKRLNLSLTIYYHPEFLEDIGLFVQYYHGSDYYNIYFNHQLDMLRFGLMTEKLRF